ncbi:MAG: PH domain-containing protein [Verrucomicrobiota bacterium]
METENVVWHAKPSNWCKFSTYFFCLILAGATIAAAIILMQPLIFAGMALPFLIALGTFIAIKSTSYKLTDQRFFVDEGIFTRVSNELELYRIKDITVVRPFFLRLVGRGSIVLHTSDKTHPKLRIRGVRDIDHVRDHIRNLVELWREKKHVREVDRSGDLDLGAELVH